MRRYFIDTSALAKLYHQEAGSDFVESLLALSQPPVISRLSLVEMESVLAIKVRTAQLDLVGQTLARRRLLADIAQGRLQVGPPIEDRHYMLARKLLVQHGATMSIRTLDAIQLAVALDLLAEGDITTMVAADQRLCPLAELSGCPTCNPAEQRPSAP